MTSRDSNEFGTSESPLRTPRRWAGALALIVGLSGCASGPELLMPNVTGSRLDVALSDIKRAGISAQPEVVGGGMFGILDESGWTVCEQLPAAGKGIDGTPRLTVDRTCGATAEETPAPEASPAGSVSPAGQGTGAQPTADPDKLRDSKPSTTASADTELVLTPANNKELKEMLAEPENCGNKKMEAFSKKYQGRKIKFDGSIAALSNHEDYTTRFDILISPGDKGDMSGFGPTFQYRNVNIVFDLNLEGPNVPDYLGVNDKLTVVAEVGEYNSDNCLFFLEPVSTRVR